MPDIENLLRAELKQTAQQVQPELLRPLRAPAPRRVWRPRLLPIAAAATVIAIIAVVALVTGLPASRQTPATRPVPAAAPPRYYVTILDVPHGQGMQVQAVVRATDGGRVTGTVTIPAFHVDDLTFVTAAADGRSFILSTYDDQAPDSLGGDLDVRLFRFAISADGQPGQLTELTPAPIRSETTQGIALSPDGRLLAVSLTHHPFGRDNIGALEVINLATGTTRMWTAPAGRSQYYVPGPPSWADGNRMVAFTWLRTGLGGITSVTEGVRLLDTSAPGDDLAAAKPIVPAGVDTAGSIESALITPDGRDVIVATFRDLSPQATRHTVVVQFAELQAGTGKLVRVLRTQTAQYDQSDFIGVADSLNILSLGSDGRYALVQGVQFGWLDIAGPDPGRFTPLLAGPAGQYSGLAAW
jgi:hypothetical protein